MIMIELWFWYQTRHCKGLYFNFDFNICFQVELIELSGFYSEIHSHYSRWLYFNNVQNSKS